MARVGRPRKEKRIVEIEGNAILNSLAVAELLGCSDQVAMDLMREGTIVARQTGKSWLTTRNSVVKYLETQEATS